MSSKIFDALKDFFVEKNTDATTESESIEINLPKINFQNKNLLYWLGLIPVFFIALYIRTRNLPLLQGKYLVELDSYSFFRYSRMLLEQGSVPPLDLMRYVPAGWSTSGKIFFPKTMVVFYKTLSAIFPNLSQIEWHVIYPPIITVISFVFFFLFVRELTNHRTAFIATAFLAVIPAYIQRTGAGFADHDSFGMLWFFVSLFLFAIAWKSHDWKKFVPLAVLAGVFAGIDAATFGSSIFLIAPISLFVFTFVFLTNKSHYSMLRFLPWAIVYFFSAAYFLSQPLISFAKQLPNLFLLFAAFFVLVHFLLQKLPKVKTLNIPRSITSLLVSISILIPVNFILGFANFDIILKLVTKENVGRHFFTVAENAPPSISTWLGSFGWIFWLALLGSALYFYEIFNSEEKSNFKLQLWSLAAYAALLVTYFVSRVSTPNLSGVASFFANTFYYWLSGFVFAMLVIFLIAYYKDHIHLQNIETKWPWLLLAIWLITLLLAAREQVRLLFETVPAIAIAAAVCVSYVIDLAYLQKRFLKYAILVAMILVTLFAFASAANQSLQTNQYSGSMVPGPWGDAMTWIRENTPQDAVFAHWWDYGHLTVAVGERAAVTDGSNAKGWNYQSGRYFLTGKNETETLTYLKTHNVTHLLISDQEIPKYYAFSYIGSDENYDRRSTIGVFALQDVKEVRNGSLLIYGGGWGFDKDYLLGDKILPEGQAFISNFEVPQSITSLQQAPKADVVYNGQQYQLDVPCLWAQGKRVNFETNPNSTINGCVVLVPYIQDQNNVNAIGGAVWASEKVWDTNLARLYIYNETDLYIKLVYEDSTPLALYQGRLVGPIKIWEVNYPEFIKPDPFYLQSSKYG